MTGIELLGVSKRYGDVQAIDDVSLEVPGGKVLMLVGPSGCGKTTLLRLIAGLETPDAGAIRFDGKDVTRVPPRERNIAMVFEGYALYPHMAVRDNLAFALRLRRTPPAQVDRRVSDVAHAMELDSLLERKPPALASGEAQQVAVGRVVMRDTPSVLLLDDALAHLDARQRLEARVEVSRLQRELGCTVVSVTHDQEEALAIGHHLAVMDAARLLQVGTPQEIYERPANVFVAGFIGSPPMNLLPMEPQHVDGRLRLRRGPVDIAAPDRWAAGDVRAVTIGIRPDDVELRAVASADEVGLDARCDLVEYLGSKLVVHLHVGEDELVAIADAACDIEPGDDVVASISLDRIHLFDTRTGEALVPALPVSEPAHA